MENNRRKSILSIEEEIRNGSCNLKDDDESCEALILSWCQEVLLKNREIQDKLREERVRQIELTAD